MASETGPSAAGATAVDGGDAGERGDAAGRAAVDVWGQSTPWAAAAACRGDSWGMPTPSACELDSLVRGIVRVLHSKAHSEGRTVKDVSLF